MKIISYNVNGIRSAMSKGLADYFQQEKADVYCLQETKAQPDQIDTTLFTMMGYACFWHSAEKKGYSGVGILTKKKPNRVVYGCGNPLYDREGRVIRVDFDDMSVLSVYMPSGTSGEERQLFKFGWLDFFLNYITELKKKFPIWWFVAITIFAIGPLIFTTQKAMQKIAAFYRKNENGWKPILIQVGLMDSGH
jgi:exodeoxyribonuclease-3